jgi:nascent polypeptide-associated complex subunit alpha
MFGGGGGMNPRKMKQMMEQMGIDVEEIEASEVVIRTDEGDLVFDDASVTKMDARGQETYQIVGSPETHERTDDGGEDAAADDGDADADAGGVPDDDVEIVAMRTGVDEATAREALEAVDGDLAAAVDRLE